MPQAVIFIHAPKCGGTSVGSALRGRYIHSQATINLQHSAATSALLYPDATGTDRIHREFDVRDVMLAQLVRRRIQCISAHTRYQPSVRRADPIKRKYITVLRDPVARFVSHFLYLQRRHPDSVEGNTLDSFLDSEQALRLGSEYLFYFARTHQIGHMDTAPLIQEACENLSTFDVVGDTSEMDAFRQKVERSLGVRLLKLNRNRRPTDTKPAFSAVEIDRIRDLCKPDLEIYDFATRSLIGAS